MADSRGRFIELLTGGAAPFILFYPTMAVASIPLILGAPAAADVRTRDPDATTTWMGLRAALAVVALLVAHTALWYGTLLSCIPTKWFLTDVLRSGCFAFYGALDFLLYGIVAFLAVAVFGTPGSLAISGRTKTAASATPAAIRISLLWGLAAILLSAAAAQAQVGPAADRPRPRQLVVAQADIAQSVATVTPDTAAGPASKSARPKGSSEDDKWHPWSREINVGFRTDAEPFSFEARVWTPDGHEYKGYIADLCYDIFAGGEPYRINEVPVSAVEDRFEKLKSGEIDVLCDPLTMRFADKMRWQYGVYSPIVFASGISYLKRGPRSPGAPILVGYVKGTTSVRLAEDSCLDDLFNVIPAKQRSATPTTCAIAKAQEELATAEKLLRNGTARDGDAVRLTQAAANSAADAIKAGKKERDKPAKESEAPSLESLGVQLGKAERELDTLRRVLPRASRAGSAADRRGLAVLTQAVVTAFGAECDPPAGGAADRSAISQVQYRFCPFPTHDKLVDWFCASEQPSERRVYMGDHEIALTALAQSRVAIEVIVSGRATRAFHASQQASTMAV